MTFEELVRARCKPLKGAEHRLDAATVRDALDVLADWQLDAQGQTIGKTFAFDDFHRTMAFVNALAWIAHQQDHHPDLEIGYSRCIVRYSTHDVGGVSHNDLICAAKVDALLGHA
ncbi:MAG: 4a-hydroxytetrahydrobiopterin dehydratase [Dokdonella sp.]